MAVVVVLCEGFSKCYGGFSRCCVRGLVIIKLGQIDRDSQTEFVLFCFVLFCFFRRVCKNLLFCSAQDYCSAIVILEEN